GAWACGPDSETLYARGPGRIGAYESRTGEPRQALRNLRKEGDLQGKVSGLWCHPQGHYLVAATDRLHFFAGPANVSPAAGLLKAAGQRVAFDRRGDRLAVLDDNALTIFDASGQPMHKLSGKFSTSFVLHPSGQEAIVVSKGGDLEFLDAAGHARQPIPSPAEGGGKLRVGGGKLQLSPDGHLLAVGLISVVLLWESTLP